MRAHFTRLMTVAVVLVGIAAAPATSPLSEKEKIETLIKIVGDLKDAKFVRNDKEYDCAEAADHMRRKWSYAGDKIKTARDFIRELATSSSQSGKPYLIRFSNGTEIKSGEFLTKELDRIENKNAASPATQPDSQ